VVYGCAGVPRRRSESSSFCRSARWWYQGNCASGGCTIARSGQAEANARMYLRFRGEYPLDAGNRDLRSVDSLSITLLPHPSWFWRLRISWPIDQ
jgi:hypothetical protein